MSTHEIRERVLEVVYREQCSPVVAVDKVLADVELDPETADALVRVGLRHLVDKELSVDRRRGADPMCESEERAGSVRSGRFQLRPAMSESSARYYWLNKVYSTEDGRQLPLILFEHVDLTNAVEWSGKLAAEYAALQDLFACALGYLDAHPRAKRVADLPKKVLEELEAVAGSVLGGAA